MSDEAREQQGDQASRALVDGIPVIWLAPPSGGAGAPLALWLPHLGGTKEDLVPFLRRLADAGFLAVGLDPWQHGERATETREQLMSRVFGAFRRHMWPILGRTTLDCLRVVDWAVDTLGAAPRVVAGGESMGGDIAVALAGIDRRVTRVAAIVATPDWTRPGMCDVADPARELPQGEPDAHAQWFRAQLNPIEHLDAYAHGPALTFECAADDTHVPPEAALRFRAALAEAAPDAAARVRVTLHPGLDHIAGVRAAAPADNCLDWFLAESPAAAH